MSVRKTLRRVERWKRYYERYLGTAPPGYSRAWDAWLKERRRVAEERERKEMPSWSRLPAEPYE